MRSAEMAAAEHTNNVVALAGNPNVGKSTVFNYLTGLKQHTGNWPGKTVSSAQGSYRHKDTSFVLVDIPGTYSLMANSAEEEIARDFLCFGNPGAVVVVVSATCLERNLNLVLQTLEITSNVVVCVNLLDEAEKKKVKVNLRELSDILGVPVVGTSARSGKGLNELMEAVYVITNNKAPLSPIKIKYDGLIEQALGKLEQSVKEVIGDSINSRWVSLKLLDNDKTLLDSLKNYLGFDILKDINVSNSLDEAKDILSSAKIEESSLRDKIVSKLVLTAEEISRKVVTTGSLYNNSTDRKIDRVLTSRTFGFPIMIFLLAIVFWITISGANYPSQLLSSLLLRLQEQIEILFMWGNAPQWVSSLFVDGIYRTIAWVVSVMLPPMAIFFPLFTLLEDLGYLPRVAFNLDNFFKKARSHGKQALTMCMGFGCNAVGITGCRIIDSPRERLIAIITNNFVPCNGRFPTLISVISMFFAGMVLKPMQSFISTLLLTGTILLGIIMTLLISKILSKTILKGLPSSFTLELPPYRRPQVGKVIVRSILDRTLFVLGRAVVVAAPAGLIIWLMANINIGNLSLLSHCAGFLNPFASLFGMDGYILMAFILGFPANEIVIPIIIMSYMSTGSIHELENLSLLRELLVSNGWTWVTAVCVMLFSLMHWPCGTTCWTIKKETQGLKWTLVSILVPTITGFIICFIVANLARLLGIA